MRIRRKGAAPQILLNHSTIVIKDMPDDGNPPLQVLLTYGDTNAYDPASGAHTTTAVVFKILELLLDPAGARSIETLKKYPDLGVLADMVRESIQTEGLQEPSISRQDLTDLQSKDSVPLKLRMIKDVGTA